MKKYGLLSLILLAGILFASTAGAQDQQSDHGHEEIIIRKKGDFPKKLDIQLNGDQVTINGKKPEDVQGNITVIRRKSSGDSGEDFGYSRGSGRRSFGGGYPGMNMFGGGGSMSINSNKALLGVLTIPSDSSQGARIEEVERGTPADSVGLRKNDVITKVGTRDILSAQDLTEAIGEYEPGDVVSITYNRDGASHETDVQLGRNDNAGARGMMSMPAMPRDHYYFQSPYGESGPQNFMQQFRRNHPFLNPYGANPERLNPEPRLGMRVEDRSDKKGVTVKKVTAGSAADAAGFKAGDVLIAIDGDQVSSVDDVLQALQSHQGDDTLKATVDRDGKKKTLEVEMPGRHQSADL